MQIRSLLRTTAFFAAVALAAMPVHADVTVSTGSTSNMRCSATACTATASNAVLNVSQLQNLLASSSVTVSTGKTANNIVIISPFGWASANGLTLEANQSLAIDATVSVSGPGGFSIATNKGGTGGTGETLSFGATGNVTFLGLTNALTINGAAYTLVGDIATLASDIAANASGNYALAASYNAKPDGKYTSSPITTAFTGTFEGLGNTIGNLTILDKKASDANAVGLFAEVDAGGVLRDIGVVAGKVTGGNETNVGELVGNLYGSVLNAWSTGSSTVGDNTSAPNGGIVADAGGLVGVLIGTGVIANSYSIATIAGGGSAFAGGLVGGVFNGGTIENSYATGNATVGDNTEGGSYSGAVSGGLVGVINNSSGPTTVVTNDHATGNATSGINGASGGLVGAAGGPATIELSYATGTVSVQAGNSTEGYSFGGGLVGFNYTVNNIGDTIDQCFASGAVAGSPTSFVGGLVGYTIVAVTNSYATGAVSASGSGFTGLGGLAGDLDTGGTIATSYSTGQVALVAGSYSGGFVGYDVGTPTQDYWDITTSGIGASNGAGNETNAPGIKGKTTAQLKAGLPAGFSSTIWGESASINGGLPYLLNNPPP